MAAEKTLKIPQIDVAIDIARALDVSIEYLVKGRVTE